MRFHHLRISSAVLALTTLVATAEDRSDQQTRLAEVYKSSHFVLYTDLPAREAEKKLSRMEAVLTFAGRYWRRAPRGRVDCYLVVKPENWPDSALPHPLARVWVGELGGATIGELVDEKLRRRNKATVYSAERSGIIEHEVIHAYCVQTFGEMGPDWYKEGMADVASLRVAGQRGVACAEERIKLLREGPPRTARQVISGTRFTYRISDSLGAMLENREDVHRHVPLSAWTKNDAKQLRVAKASYAWSWALCHMLHNNRNYSDRFRALGTSYLQKREDSFARSFSSMGKELEFELAFFTQRVDVGYRVDLCSWDWHKPFRTLETCPAVNIRVRAARGFQASGLQVADGGRYKIQATGFWTTSANGHRMDADGAASGEGKLVGVVMNDFRLSQPFELGAAADFVAPISGNLYLRCQDAWHNLADNGGEIDVQFTRG